MRIFWWKTIHKFHNNCGYQPVLCVSPQFAFRVTIQWSGSFKLRYCNKVLYLLLLLVILFFLCICGCSSMRAFIIKCISFMFDVVILETFVFQVFLVAKFNHKFLLKLWKWIRQNYFLNIIMVILFFKCCVMHFVLLF